MTRDLRTPLKAHLFDGSAGLCSLSWQGDFGKGVVTGSNIFEPGVSPYILYGPVAAGATSVMASSAGYGSNAIPQIPQQPGTVVSGGYDTEWVLCRYVSTGTPDLKPGQVWTIDENYTAILALTSGRVLNSPVGVSMVFMPAVPAGTYYIWLARAGRLLIRDGGSSIATGMAETTATAGVVKFLNSHTGGSATLGPFSAFAASSNITFKADTVNGSPYLQNLTSQIAINGNTAAAGPNPQSINDLCVGMTVTGTGMPSNALILAIDNKGPGGAYRATLGTDTAGAFNTTQNATATNTQTTLTVTSHVQALLYWPTTTALN